jgi:hypothetical protein
MVKFRERKTRDFNQVKCIKDEADKLLVKDMILRTDRENILTSYTMKIVKKPRLSWTTHFMILIGDLFGEFKSLR